MPRIDPTTALYALILAIGGAMFVLIFWTMGAVNLYTGTGLMYDMILGDVGRVLFFSYPFVVVIAAFGSIGLYVARQTAPAVALAGLPIVGVTAFYLVLTILAQG